MYSGSMDTTWIHRLVFVTWLNELNINITWMPSWTFPTLGVQLGMNHGFNHGDYWDITTIVVTLRPLYIHVLTSGSDFSFQNNFRTRVRASECRPSLREVRYCWSDPTNWVQSTLYHWSGKVWDIDMPTQTLQIITTRNMIEVQKLWGRAPFFFQTIFTGTVSEGRSGTSHLIPIPKPQGVDTKTLNFGIPKCHSTIGLALAISPSVDRFIWPPTMGVPKYLSESMVI